MCVEKSYIRQFIEFFEGFYIYKRRACLVF